FFWMRLASFVWLPGLLWALLRLARHDTLRPGPLVATAVAMAMAWLGGFPPFATTTTVIAGCLCLWLLGSRLRTKTRRDTAHLAMRLLLGLGLGAMLAMPQVLPSLLFFPQSARTPDPSLADIAGSAFELYGLTGYLLPDLISHPSVAHELPYDRSPLALLLNVRRLENGSAALPNYNYTEYAVFTGTLGFLLALFGAVFGRGRRRAFALSMFLLLLGLALFVPGVRLLFVLPVIKNVWPMRWLAPATLFVAWLAAIGLERALDAGRRTLLTFSGIALAMAAFVWWCTSRVGADATAVAESIAARHGVTVQGVVEYVQTFATEGFDRFAAAFARAAAQGVLAAWGLALAALWLLALGLLRDAAARRWLALAAGAASALQLGWHGASVTRGVEATHPTDTAVHAFLRERAAEAAPTGGFTIVRASVEPSTPAQLPPGQLMVEGVRDLHFYTHYDARSLAPLRTLLGPTWGERAAAKGYLTLSLPDALPTPAEQKAAAAPGAAPLPKYTCESVLEHPLLDLLGVRYVLTTRTQPKEKRPEELEHAGARVGPELRGPGGEFLVYERPHPLPRAFAVPELRVLPNDAAVVTALVDPSLAPDRVAYACADDNIPAAPSPAANQPRSVRFLQDHPSVVELDIGAGTSPWLVLTDTFLPGWTAAVNDMATTIVRANHSQRAVRLPPQACRVRFVYSSPGLAAGTVLASLAAVVLLALALLARRRVTATTAA
ncbi:MAG: hypothetical protein ABIP94_22360, partial [Planctomycetota bacterium]